jgi:hypothetical protein
VILFGPEPHRQGSGLLLGWGWVAEIGGCIAWWCEHPTEKSASNYKDSSIHRLIKGTLRKIVRTRD